MRKNRIPPLTTTGYTVLRREEKVGSVSGKENDMDTRKEIYFTVTGLCYAGISDPEFIERGMTVKLVKEPDNDVDKEAIMVKLPGIGKIGYVANSIYTVIGDEAYSAGRIYDKIGDEAYAVVEYNMKKALQCRLLQDDKIAE